MPKAPKVHRLGFIILDNFNGQTGSEETINGFAGAASKAKQDEQKEDRQSCLDELIKQCIGPVISLTTLSKLEQWRDKLKTLLFKYKGLLRTTLGK